MDLPALLVLAPFRTVLHRGPGAVQLGLDPNTGVEVRGLTDELVGMLVELDRPAPTVELLDRYSTAGAPRAELAGLLARLVERGALVDAAALRRVESARRNATVVAHGDGPLAVGVAIALAAAGVGTVYVAADGTVRGRDLGCGYPPADRGRPRWLAAAEAVRAAAPGQVRTGLPPQRLMPDLAVLADAVVPAAPLVDALLSRRVPHLAVRLRDGSGLIGPLVLPGRSSCLRCLDLQRAADDPGWPMVAAQLAGRCGSASTSCVGAAAALAAEAALAALAGPASAASRPALLNGVLEFDTRSAVLHRRPLTPHPDCPCGAAGVGCGDRPARETITK
jgi:bacteriocin biosynthesis cyclodehydratase domain-containing protein